MTETQPAPREVRLLGAPAARADTLVLAGGKRLYLRPIEPDDRAGLAALFGRLSPESRRLRYLLPKRALTSRELACATDVDHVRDEAIVAIDVSDGSIVGVARYAHDVDRPGVADMAVEVADDLQSLGIGTQLARRIVDRARANGFFVLTATTLWENREARALLRRLGFRACWIRDGTIDQQLQLHDGAYEDTAGLAHA